MSGGRERLPVRGNQLNERACAVLALTTRLAWSPELPPPLSRTVVRRMLDTGMLESLVLCDAGKGNKKWLERASVLLSRVRAVHEEIAAYEREGYYLLMPGCELWPDSINVLGVQTPLFLFAKGNMGILAGKKIAVAGSRRLEEEASRAARQTGQMIAEEGAVLVTGGAQGADSAAIDGALSAGGSAVIVPAKSVQSLLLYKRWKQAIEAGRMLLLCDTLPDEPFSTPKALSRNHTIYALSEAALVVAARSGQGGSWRGAVDCLRGGWSPVYVWDGCSPDTLGNRELIKLGASPYTLQKPLLGQFAVQEQMSLFGEQKEGASWL